MTLLAFRADTIGGLLGVREVAKRAGITLGVAGLPAIDHAWNAKAILVASAVPEPLLTTASTPDIPPDLDARVVAVSFATKNAIVADLPGGTFSYCNPSLEDRAGEALCVFSGAQTWRTMGADAVGAVARAKLPFWLFGLGGVNDPVAMKLATQLATLARRLKQDGFEPTTADAITETPHGVEILGRSNEDAIVAVGLMASAPFVFPYADGPAWTLDGQPRIIQLEPTRTLALPASVRPLPSKDKRRTVVFRHAVH